MADGVIQQGVEQRAPRRPAGPGRTIPRLTFAEQLVLWSARRMATLDHGAAATESEASACRRDVLARVAGELGAAATESEAWRSARPADPRPVSKRRKRWRAPSMFSPARAGAACA